MKVAIVMKRTEVQLSGIDLLEQIKFFHVS